MIIFYNIPFTSSSKYLWFLKIKGLPYGCGGSEVGVQDLLVASEDIATGIFWGL